MLFNLFSYFHPKEPVRSPTTTRFRPPGVIEEEHFHLLASLQMAVRNEGERCVLPSSAAEMLHGANDPNLRKQVQTNPPVMFCFHAETFTFTQGRLCLTFALKNHDCASPPEKIRIANELEVCNILHDIKKKRTTYDKSLGETDPKSDHFFQESIDAAYSEEDYRHRIYRIGGYLNVFLILLPPPLFVLDIMFMWAGTYRKIKRYLLEY